MPIMITKILIVYSNNTNMFDFETDYIQKTNRFLKWPVMLCSFCNSCLIPEQNIRISELPYHNSASLIHLLAAERPGEKKPNLRTQHGPKSWYLLSFKIQQQLLTTTSVANKWLLSGCCLPDAAEAQSSIKIPLASWPSVRETFFTHYVLMPSLQYLCVLVKEKVWRAGAPQNVGRLWPITDACREGS